MSWRTSRLQILDLTTGFALNVTVQLKVEMPTFIINYLGRSAVGQSFAASRAGGELWSFMSLVVISSHQFHIALL